MGAALAFSGQAAIGAPLAAVIGPGKPAIEKHPRRLAAVGGNDVGQHAAVIFAATDIDE